MKPLASAGLQGDESREAGVVTVAGCFCLLRAGACVANDSVVKYHSLCKTRPLTSRVHLQ